MEQIQLRRFGFFFGVGFGMLGFRILIVALGVALAAC